MAPKSTKNRCWKPSKSMSNYFKLFKSFQIDFFYDFYEFQLQNGTQNGPQNQSKIDPEASWPLRRAPRRPKIPPGPNFKRIFNIFDWFWKNSGMILLTILRRFQKKSDDVSALIWIENKIWQSFPLFKGCNLNLNLRRTLQYETFMTW